MKYATLLTSLLVSAATASIASAAPITALSCSNPATQRFVTVGIQTIDFMPSNQKTLHYSVHMGEVVNGGSTLQNETKYAQDSNMKIFDNDAQAVLYVMKNTIVIPLDSAGHLDAVLLVDREKKKVSIVDTNSETIETLTCLAN